MNRLLAALAGLGAVWDRVTAATRRTPPHVREALATGQARRAGAVAAGLMLVLFLLAVGDIAISASGRWAAAPLLRAAPENVFTSRAPYLFEPVLALHPSAHFAVFVSPVNVLLGGIVALLVGCNVAAAQRSICRRRGYGRLTGVLPAFLLGFACCTPTVLLALGTSAGAAILPVLLPLRPIFYPLTLALLTAGLVWGTRRMADS